MPDELQISEYYWAPRSGFPDSLAQMVGKELLALREELGRGPTAHDVLRYATTHRRSAIAKCYDWDLQAAAHAQWVRTASDILRAIRVRIITPEITSMPNAPKVIDVRLMHNVRPHEATADTDGRVYLPATEALMDSGYRHQMLDAAIEELDRWKHRHAHLKELDIFFRALEDAKAAYKAQAAA